ncbi:alpha-2-macroglobulin family protein [Dinghuibacter silviterrae]|uniref:Carboxypeptidase-like protein n=1 Tax=Dinghuibacter silviterrae TaxID=1539049 RepID=A0A4R8DPI2_9BACT|nr:alpha-2-macroglobulin family protein [Dinghuibacter silviterrae]TDW99617.1 carboxypeptidase-like protein [Dinghuibacter silviterrae]
MRWTLCLTLILPLGALAQASLKNMHRDSYEEFVYRIDAAKAQWCIRHDSIPLDELLEGKPFAAFPAGSVDRNRLPAGQYIDVRVVDNRLISVLLSITDLMVYPVSDGGRMRLMVRRRETPDSTVDGADVRVNGRKAVFLAAGHCYLPGRVAGGFVRVAVPGDTTFQLLEQKVEDRPYRYRPRGQGPWAKIRRWFTKSHYGQAGVGTMLFSQPKYKPMDTVRLKAYILDRKGRRWRTPLDLYLEYVHDGAPVKHPLGLSTPAVPGSFAYEFPLPDTLPRDTRYTVSFRNRRGEVVFKGYFSIEEYLLNQVTDYRFRAERTTVYAGDSVRLLASASDANGLPILDARFHVALLRGEVRDFGQDTVYVPDTLYTAEKPLSTEGETVLGSDTRRLPEVVMDLQANGSIIDASGERHDQTDDVTYAPGQAKLDVRMEGDSVLATYQVNGRPVARDGFLRIQGVDLPLLPVHYPVARKVEPFAESYHFYIGKPGAFTDSTEDEPEAYEVNGYPNCRNDTLGFLLDNPRRVPVAYTVWMGNSVLERGWSNDREVSWARRSPRVHDTYQVRWTYIWGGKERKNDLTLRTPYRVLTVHLDGKQTIYPGQKDTLHIRVTDAWGRPDPGTDLTAYSYNSQFQGAIHNPFLTLFGRYHNRSLHSRPGFDTDDPQPGHWIPLGAHQGWIKPFGLDSLPYYNMLYPRAAGFMLNTHLPDFIPKIAVYVVRKGVPQRIYLLYLNKQLVYYDGVTDPLPYVFDVPPAYTRIGVRLYDRYLEIDSVYAQPFYRRDVVIDLDHLPKMARSRPMPPYLTWEETDLLSGRLWQMQSTSLTQYGYIYQGDRGTQLRQGNHHLVGPFEPTDSLRFLAPGFFESHFLLEPVYEYMLSPQFFRLEKTDPLHRIGGKAWLAPPGNGQWVLGDTLTAPPVLHSPQAGQEERFIFLEAGHTREQRIPGYGQLLVRWDKDTVLQYMVLYPEKEATSPLVLGPIREAIENVVPGTYTLLLVDTHFRTLERQHLRILPDQLLCMHTEGLLFRPDNPVITRLADESLERLRRQWAAEVKTPLQTPAGEKPAYTPDFPAGTAMVWGRVIDAHGGLGIAGASVMVTGTKTGCVTDGNGYFQLRSVRAGRLSLTVLSVGYATNRLDADAVDNAAQPVIVKLDVRDQGLADVVVTGYGEQRRSLSYSVTTVAGVSLEGRIPGLNIQEALDTIALKDAGAKAFRDTFRDYGFWKPRILMDDNGRAAVEVTYPDNITRWRNFVVGMDRYNRMGVATSPVISFKPLVASLSTPAFLVEGDSADLVGKVLNYTNRSYPVRSGFEEEDAVDTVGGKSSVVRFHRVAGTGDSLKASFVLQTGAYKDGEERRLPVYPVGVKETGGRVFVLEGDTTVIYPFTGRPATLYARGNMLDVLQDRLRYLKEYPYFCMEQTSSKLTGLLAERRMDVLLHKRFDGDKDVDALVHRLEKNQLFSGGWSWWGGGSASLRMTCYVIRALLPLRSDPLVGVALREGLLYLQNSLPSLPWRQLPDPLRTMAEAGHVMDYTPLIRKIVFDSLDQHNGWTYVRLLQRLGLDYREPMQKLLRKATPGMLGSIHWGDADGRWYGNDIATTVQAYEVLSADTTQRSLLPAVRLFLLGDHAPYAYNTVEAATVVSTLLQDALVANPRLATPIQLRITGDTTCTLTRLPATFQYSGQRPLVLSKIGGGTVYATVYEEHWNPSPFKVDSLFAVHTSFIRDGRETRALKVGERVNLRVRIEVKKEAEYTMIEVPIPAGCTFGDKPFEYEVHREYFKDKVVLFTDWLSRGVHEFNIPLEVRYGGRFTLNPVRVSLMYFPVLYGRNALEQVTITH